MAVVVALVVIVGLKFIGNRGRSGTADQGRPGAVLLVPGYGGSQRSLAHPSYSWTGMSERYFDSVYFEDYPAIPEEVAEYLVSKQIKIVGVDTCSVDHEEFVAHRTLLKNDVLIIENLTNLQELAGKEFTVYALPIKLQIDGAPARVIAAVD